ncbi:hypothetical protein BDC45DRAFT_568238 [Circinella umbellata]|nr:hypothetical protein BDC45DRAFT_568238 [Circinella umbellata]
MIRSTRSLASQATTTFTSIANPTSNVQRIRSVVNPPTPILTSAPFFTSPPASDHVFSIPVSARRAGDNRVAIGNPYAIAPTPTLPDPAPARWVNANWVATSNAFALSAVGGRVGAGATVPGVSATSSRISSVATATVITPPASLVTTSAAVPATIPAATPTTTSAPTSPTIPAATPTTTSIAVTATVPATAPAITSAPTPPARPILTPRPIRAIRDARAARAGATGAHGENEEERRDENDAEDDDVKMEIDWKFGDLEYMNVDWCEGDMDVDIVPPNATSLWF